MFLKLAYQNMFSIVSQMNNKNKEVLESHPKERVFDVTGEKDVVTGKGAL